MFQSSTLKLLGLKMDTAVVQQFLSFFRDYIDLCQTENWPTNTTSEQELRNAFLMSQHVEKCLDKLQKKGIIDEFLSVLSSHQGASESAYKSYLLDCPKYLLKKIINSNTNVNQMDIAFKLYLELFSEDKLEACLADLMVEAASKETLLSSFRKEVGKDQILKFKTELLLSEMKTCNMKILEIISNCNETTVELLVFCLLNSDLRNEQAVKHIKHTFINILSSKDCAYRNFWRLLFKVDDKYFVEMCADNSDIYQLIVESLLDYGKLLREGMSTELFYIDVGRSELQSIVRRICKNENLKLQFFNIVKIYDTDNEFWINML